jgi:hypothetical protein
MKWIVVLILAGMLGTPKIACAQFDKLLDRVETVNLYYSRGGFSPRSSEVGPKSQDGVVGYGVEFGFTVGKYNPDPEGLHRLLLTLGLGYGETGHFRARSSAINIHGSVWELPALAIYATRWVKPQVAFYVGMRSGVAQLHNMSVAISTDSAVTRHKMEGTTFQGGLALGLSVDLGRGAVKGVQGFGALVNSGSLEAVTVGRRKVVLFLEGAYTYRNFRGIHYAEAKAPPSDAPGSLSFSVLDLSLGIEFDIGKK